MADPEERRVARWVSQHKQVSAAILIGGVSFICLVVGGPAAGSDSLLNRVAGAMATSLLLGLIVYVSMSVAKGLGDAIAMVSPVIYGLAALALFLLSLFVFIWIIKRMWEAA